MRLVRSNNGLDSQLTALMLSAQVMQMPGVAGALIIAPIALHCAGCLAAYKYYNSCTINIILMGSQILIRDKGTNTYNNSHRLVAGQYLPVANERGVGLDISQHFPCAEHDFAQGTKEQIADPLTKPVDRACCESFRTFMNGETRYPETTIIYS